MVGIIVFNQQKEKEVLETLTTFQQNHPEIEFPTEFDLKKEKKWDSGIVQYKLKSDKKDYYVQIKEQEVVKLFTKKPDAQLYPVVSNNVQKETTIKDGISQAVDGVKSWFTNEEKPKQEESASIPVPTEPKEMSKVEYTITVSKLLGEALINIEDSQMIVESPELTKQSIEEATQLLNESIELYEQLINIVPPEDWKVLHDNIVKVWNEWIIGEQGLIDQMEKAWGATADERQQAWEVTKEKSKVVGEYSFKLGELILQFLGELTGFSN